ncbi:MAG: Uma2 family endonuclease [Ktedonobacteraceae bacterium]|nr:Uma2 family endonuclease [Ktedonobacteraceae bacterium]
MATHPQPGSMSFEQYLILDQNNPDVRYEYLDGQVRAMAGGTLDHSALGVRICWLLSEALGIQGPCRVYNSDARVRIDAVNKCYRPDAVITCDISNRGTATIISSPHVVVEVLSPGTQGLDRGDKFRDYQLLPTLQEYVLINYQVQLVEVYQREADRWTFRSYRAGEEIDLRSIDIQVAVDQLYAGIQIPAHLPESADKENHNA